MEEKPSKCTEGYWITAFSDDLMYGGIDNRKGKAGKWLIFVNREDIDEVWTKVKKATEEGKLSIITKVSTAKLSRNI